MHHHTLFLSLHLTWLLFVFALGACVGSLTNVLVYRLPRGKDVIFETSRCPSCNHELSMWRENVPILGWLALRGRCRYCKAKISPEYIIVELVVALLFAGVWALWYVLPNADSFGMEPIAYLQPEWAANGWKHTWPIAIVMFTLLGSLVAVTLVDARTFHIPLVLVWVPTVAAIVGHVGWAAWHGPLRHTAEGAIWAIPTPPMGPLQWAWIGGAIGASAGLLFSNVMVWAGLLGRSFADYDAWEREQLKAKGYDPDTVEPEELGEDAAVWLEYPHARREMIREIVFLLPALAFGVLGAALANRFWGGQEAVPFWLDVAGGVALGIIVGGGLVWAVRILGTLAFGKEAMGLGDVHLMAAVGAAIGWIDPILAFFAACVFGAVWGGVGRLFGGAKVLPFGPYLAVGTVLVMVLKPVFELGLARMLHAPIDLP